MPTDSKKKRKAAKKKKKKLLRNKTKQENGNGININQSSTGQNDLEIPLLDQHSDYIQQDSDSSSSTQSHSSFSSSNNQLMEGFGIKIPNLVEKLKEDVLEVVKDGKIAIEKKLSDGVSLESASSSKLTEKIESLKEGFTEELKKEGEKVDVEGKATVSAVKEVVSEGVGYDPVEKVVTVSEELGKFVETGKVKIEEKLAGVVPVEKSKIVEVVESVSKGIEGKILSSLKAVKGESTSSETGEGAKEVDESSEASQNQSRSVTFAPEAIQRATWKNCCGLFEAFSSSNR